MLCAQFKEITAEGSYYVGYSRTNWNSGKQELRVSVDAAEDTIAKTLATEAPVAIWTATDCPVQGIQFPMSVTLCEKSQ